MKVKTKQKVIKDNRWKYILASVTLIFFSTFQDPFNVPKLIALLVCVVFVLSDVMNKLRDFFHSEYKIFSIIALIYLSALLISALFSDYIFISIFGDTLRRNGLITYVFLIIFMFYLIFAFKANQIITYVTFVGLISLLIGFYGVLQFSGRDFVKWSASGGIVSTLGNSNFTGALGAILASQMFIAIFQFKSNSKAYILSIVGSISAFSIIYFSKARQGFFASLFAIGLICSLLVFRKNRKLGSISIVAFVSILFVAVLGIFNHGPLSQVIYKYTIDVRSYYWKAAIKMFLNHPFFGVGIDRYGAYFKEFREVGYPLKYGFEITSTNAHNIVLQNFATGGIFCGVTYLVLVAYTFVRAFRYLLSKSNPNPEFVSVIFSGWIAYQIQGLVSIDNIGLSVWGWALTGLLIASTSAEQFNANPLSLSIINGKKYLVTALSLITILPLIGFLSVIESNQFKLRIGFAPNQQETRSGFVSLASSTLRLPFLDPAYKTVIGGALLDYGEESLGLQTLNSVLASDKRNLNALSALSAYYELKGNLEQAINIRKQIEKYDPWNAKNDLQIARDYKFLNKSLSANEYANKGLSYAANSDVGEQIKKEFQIG